MDKYETIEIIGSGSYGVVIKCRHRESGQLVAIKRLLQTEDYQVRRLAFREIMLLQKLQHENLVNMIEVFRRRKRIYLVLEYLDHNLLQELEKAGGNGLPWEISMRHMYQVLRGLNFCHTRNIMHRDVKPENVLVSPNQVIKLCDFGFARLITGSNESCTDYVATRWYRAPELLVGDPHYGRAVDIWAAGCLLAEMITGNPLFPGNSDADQLYRITRVLGGLCSKHQVLLHYAGSGETLRRSHSDELMGPVKSGIQSIRILFPQWDTLTSDFLAQCLRMDPDLRPRCSVLMQHPFFAQNRFNETFLIELKDRVSKDAVLNPLAIQGYRSETASGILKDTIERTRRNDRKDDGTVGHRWQVVTLKDKSRSDRLNDKSTEPEEKGNSRRLMQSNHPGRTRRFDSLSISPNTVFIRAVKRAPAIVNDR